MLWHDITSGICQLQVQAPHKSNFKQMQSSSVLVQLIMLRAAFFSRVFFCVGAQHLKAECIALQALSPVGRCKSFEASADGYGRGEGFNAIMMRALDASGGAAAQTLALIQGSAVNQDGRSSSLTAPNGPAQQVLHPRRSSFLMLYAHPWVFISLHLRGLPPMTEEQTVTLNVMLAAGAGGYCTEIWEACCHRHMLCGSPWYRNTPGRPHRSGRTVSCAGLTRTPCVTRRDAGFCQGEGSSDSQHLAHSL